jgi:hypothetical protein
MNNPVYSKPAVIQAPYSPVSGTFIIQTGRSNYMYIGKNAFPCNGEFSSTAESNKRDYLHLTDNCTDTPGTSLSP